MSLSVRHITGMPVFSCSASAASLSMEANITSGATCMMASSLGVVPFEPPSPMTGRSLNVSWFTCR